MMKSFPGTDLRAEPHINSKIHTDANAQSMRYKAFPFYLAWCEIFGKDRATGEHAEDCNAAAADVLETGHNKEREQAPNDWINGANYVFEDDNIDTSVCQSKEIDSGEKSKSKKRKSKDTTDEKFVEIMGKYCNETNQRLGEMAKRKGYEFNAFKKRADVYEALGRLPGLGISQKIYIAKLLVNNSKDLDLFFSLPDEERAEMVRMMLTGQI
ncbi:hypothetical protein Pfo_002133 [Paulownia fortunei]|nr:hypothetical protein Pfo_002133 [Paulownia fortunei]